MPAITFFDLASEIDSYFNENSLGDAAEPNAVILTGGVATGKTTLRRKQYSDDYVLIDSAQIFHNICGDSPSLDFPGALKEPLEFVGAQITRRALSERRNIVTEIIGAEPEPVIELVNFLKALGYKVEVVAVKCDVEESIMRAAARGDNISAHYAESIHTKWILDTCAELIRVRDSLGMAAMHSAMAKTTSDREPPKEVGTNLIFRDSISAFEFACKFLSCDVQEGAHLPAIVLDSREEFGTEVSVNVQNDGNQLAAIRVASPDGGFTVMATTAGPKGALLVPNQLVAWLAMKYMPELSEAGTDKRFGWAGLIIGTLKPEFVNETWVGDESFYS